MKKHDRIDAMLDMIILAVLTFAVMITVVDPVIRYVLIVAGCGAMFNNVKYFMKKKKKKNTKKKASDKKKKEKEVKEENK